MPQTAFSQVVVSLTGRFDHITHGQLVEIIDGLGATFNEYSVVVDRYGHPWDAQLIRSEAAERNNDFYHLQLLQDKKKQSFRVWGCWGRIGQPPRQLKCAPCDADTAKADFERRILNGGSSQRQDTLGLNVSGMGL
ncbi:hypothetical protein BJY04DRAFT_216467 [Aspergillus karnatakaensis]|uniref:uncharacterized protein n=1 Tax=Aspergillus karnatakaensis TaxID=1810916 RepID=UPI003CCDCDF6